jgi:3-dehydro-L-gulonate 2-dehydrogenase
MSLSQGPEFLKVQYQKMQTTFYEVLLRHGFSEAKARSCATIFADNSLDGVYTHGVNRFPRFIKYITEGHVRPESEPVRESSFGCIEQWDGRLGPGPLNALKCTDRAMEIASIQGMGCVAIGNTNHWMRGGTYGWKAARNGYVFIGWTNTVANMPTWGAVNSKLGNNPLVLAVPYQDEAIVLDMAMSQYSYGMLEFYQLKNHQLPVPGGFANDGGLTTDPGSILKSQRILPVGYWKGAGLSLLLDILATILSGGLSVADISKQKAECALSQVFIAIDVSKLKNFGAIQAAITQILADYHESIPDKGSKILYPGEKVISVRKENKTNGIPVLKSVWDEIEKLTVNC